MKLNVKLRIIICISIIVCLFTACGGKADDYYKEGLKQFSEGRYNEAADSFKQAVDSNSDKADYHISYGTALISMGQYAEARTEFMGVMKDSGKKSDLQNNKKANRGIALSYFYEGDYSQAKGYFELALKNTECKDLNDDIEAYLAETYMYLGDYSTSIEKWNSIISKNDKSPEYYLKRAGVYASMGETDDAKADYNKCIDIDKYYYSAYLGLYNLQLDSDDEAGVENTIKTAIGLMEKKNETDGLDYSILQFYYQRHFAAGSVNDESFKKLYDEGVKEAAYYLGIASQDKGDYSAAEAYFNEYIQTFPGKKTAEFCNQYATCLIGLEKYDDALIWITKASDMAAGTVKKTILFNEVIVNEKLGKFDIAAQKAVAYLETYDDEDMKLEYEFIKTRLKGETS